ncbi:low-density lipoprotein receptor-related protein 4-like [Haliotis rubra]|uniref:low-density lipoprotein receptor-related protein 4-like n=1 Tax=Haliotis rubra TaxID=36100 RepID=UPI001EE50D9F|nr:low-density lipoprotein receptor-related protein 4-like [Haliotis rubra]
MLRRTGNKVWVDVHSLPPYSHIEADVVVVNTYFSSEGSNILRFSTAEGVPSSVEDVNITYRGSEDIELEWGQPGEPNGIVIGYQVGYMKDEGLEFGDLEISEIVTERRMWLGGLTPDTVYRVYVWGMTRVGRGEEFFIDIRTAEETPGLVIDDIVPTLTTVNVTWLVPDAGGLKEVANYYLEYRKLGKAGWDRVTVEQENLWQEIKGLEAGTSYQVRVWTAAGQTGTPSRRKLYSDTRTFRTISEAFLLLTQGKKIRRVDIASTSTNLVRFTKKKLKIRSPASLTFNVRKNTVFFSDKRTKSINMATIEGFQLHSAVRIYQDSNSSIFGIAYDWVHEALYWTDGRRKSIRVMTLTREDRKYITTVVDGMGKPRAIALDIQQRYLYWTDRMKPAMIGRCGMDGTNVSSIINSDITWPEGLTIDYAERRLYWTDAIRDRVSSCDMDGGDRRVVIRMPGPPDERLPLLERLEIINS